MSSYRRVMYQVGTDDTERSGVRVEYEYRTGRVFVSGWYDSIVSICPVEMSLSKFLRDLHITMEDCRKALGEGCET